MHEKTRKQCAKAIEAATQWRIDNNMVGATGFVMTYGSKVFCWSEQLPEIEKRNPICVDEQGDCFSAFQKNCWSCLTTPEKLPPSDSDKAHISSVAREMLIYCFPGHSTAINEWFDRCTVGREAGTWTRLERITLESIFAFIVGGIGADEVLARVG